MEQSIKKQLHAYYMHYLYEKETQLRDYLSELTLESKTDAKSSAGDKHETGVAMVHLEQEKLNVKLQDILNQKRVMEQLNPEQVATAALLGSVVETEKYYLYLTTALPQTQINNKPVIALSPKSPLGSILLGNTVGFEFQLMKMNQTILNIY